MKLEDYRKLTQKKNKYKNDKVEYSGIKFDSKKQARRYQDLKLLERAGEIKELEIEPSFPIEVNGVKVCIYKADFGYREQIYNKSGMKLYWDRIVEDVKSEPTKTPVYRLKKKLMKAIYNIEVREV